MELEKILKQRFGYDNFRVGQKEIIESVLQKKDVLAILPTGAGKTLCYHFPALLIDGITIVVSPLLSLMEDQVHQMRASGDKTVVQINGLLSFEEKRRVTASLNRQSILFVSPEMLANQHLLRKINHLGVGLFVVDEAHCISQWGHEFRTDYLRLNEIRKVLGEPPCLAVTATATKEVEMDIIRSLSMDEPVIHRYSVNRPQIKFIIEECETAEVKQKMFQEYLKTIPTPAIIYTGTRKDTLQLTEEMKQVGFQSVAYYHGGLSKEDRLLVQRQFLNDELEYICATNAFGMGINKPNIRTVIHMHLPSSVEQYVQEVGRAGRDGDTSIAILLHIKEDNAIPLSFIENEFLTENELHVLFQTLRGLGTELPINEVPLMLHIDDNVWRMIVYYLEKTNVIIDQKIVIEQINEQVYKKLLHHFSSRKRQKEERLFDLIQLLTSRSCIRAELLNYFGEKLESTLKECCSACGLSIDNVVFKTVKENRSSELENRSWQEELQTMLLPHKRRQLI